MARVPTGRPRGRPKGAVSLKTKLIRQAAEKAELLLQGQGVIGTFEGNALAYLMSIYRNPMFDTETRKDAAKAAIPFESSRLMASTVAHSGTLTLESLVTEAIKNPPSE